MNNQQKQYEEGIEIYDYFQMIKKRRWQILVIFIATILIAGVYSLTAPKIYESSAIIKIGKAENALIQTVDEIIRISKNKGVLIRALSPDLSEIKTRGENPKKNLEMVNQFVADLLNRHQQIYQEKSQLFETGINLMESRKTELENEITDLQNKIQALGTPTSEAQAIVFQTYLTNLNSVKYRLNQTEEKLVTKNQEKINNYQATKLETQPSFPVSPIRPNLKLNLIIGIALGFLLGLLWVFVAEYFKPRKQI